MGDRESRPDAPWEQENFSFVPKAPLRAGGFASRKPGWSFCMRYPRGNSALSALPSTVSGLRFPPWISHEKTAPSHHSRQKSLSVPAQRLGILQSTSTLSVQQDICGMVSFGKDGWRASESFVQSEILDGNVLPVHRRVIPAKAGIQCLEELMDSCFRRSNRLLWDRQRAASHPPMLDI
jgi:hypothetical protein